MIVPVAATILAVGALLACERQGFRRGAWVAKPLASTGFLWLALAAGATGSLYGRAVLGALVLCWLGDVLLLGRGRGLGLRLGLGSFLLGHLAFAVAFGIRGLDAASVLVAALLLLLPAAAALRWLLPHVPADWRAPVFAYVGVISLMVVAALGSVSGPQDLTVALGALAFYGSDLAVARERFVEQGFVNKAWGLPLYYGAQLLLAASVQGAG
jgi:uncharacterized membrane protein YhhN